MKEIEFYKFIANNGIEYHWHEDEVYFFINTLDAHDFYKILPPSILDEGGLKCALIDGYFTFEGVHICDYCGIDPKVIFDDDEK